MRILLVLLLGLAQLAAAGQGVTLRTFEEDLPGAPPPGFAFAERRGAAPGRWTVRREGQNAALVHAGDPEAGRGFAVAVLDGPALREVEASVRLRLAGGDRAGGIVWRYRDSGNFYLARLRLSNQSIAVYRIVSGNRVRIEGEDGLELDPEAWHTLKVVQGDERSRVYIGGIKVFDVRDRTFRGPGRVGLCAEGDSVAWFDDLRVRPRDDD